MIKNVLNDKQFIKGLLIFVNILMIEIIFKIIQNTFKFDWSLLRIILSSSIIALVLNIFLLFTKKIAFKISLSLIIIIIGVYALLQLGFDNFLGTYISIANGGQLNAVTDYVLDFIKSFKFIFYIVLLPGLITIIFVCFSKNNIFCEKSKYLKENIVINIILIFIFSLLFRYTLVAKFMQNDLQLVSNLELYKNPTIPSVTINQFGIINYGILDIKSILGLKINGTLNNGNFIKPYQEDSIYARKIDDSKWEILAKNEENSDYKILHNYFLSKKITPKNDYTGMFEGKNLIVIMMESINNIAINEEYFPNIYKLYNEGWSWENNYSPRNSCSTGNNEFSGMTSLYVLNNVCTSNKFMNNKYFNSIFNLFNNAGYSTTSYHNYTDQYYNRNVIHPNMGSSAYYDVNKLEIPYSTLYKEWPSDVELIEKASDIFLKDEPFMAWITTVSTHQPYYQDSELSNLYFDYFKDTDYNNTLKRYMSKLKVLDNAIGVLIDRLSKAEVLDDTVIVLYSDHYPYGLSKTVLKTILDYDITENNEIDRTPFIIYNSELTPQKFQEYTSHINILPTIANLFNLDYDPRLYFGNDLFSNSYQNRVVFADGSWQSPLGFYDAENGTIIYNNDTKYSNEDIKEINNAIVNDMKMSNLAISTNYFEYLGNSLEK